MNRFLMPHSALGSSSQTHTKSFSVCRRSVVAFALVWAASSACSTTAPLELDSREQGLVLGEIGDPGVARRTAEVTEYLQENYFSRFTVLATTQNRFGQIIDWVDPQELDPDYYKYPIESGPQPEFKDLPSSEAVEEEDDRSWKGPEGLSGLIRPDFGYYIAGKSDATTVEQFQEDLAQPQPAGQIKLYAGRTMTVDNMGTRFFMSIWNYGDVGGVGSGAFSLSQTGVICGSLSAGTMEAIEFGYIKYPDKFNDTNVHLFGFYRTAGGAVGDRQGGWNTDFVGFVPAAGATALGSVYSGTFSTVGGNVYSRGMTIVRSTTQPRWYLMLEVPGQTTETLGYYPIGATAPNIPFDLIDDVACRVDWWGEVNDITPTQWDASNMGSGSFPTGTTPAYFRQLRVFGPPAGTAYHPESGTAALGGMDAACYNVSSMVIDHNDVAFSPYFRFGGPGNDNGSSPTRPCK